MPSQGAEHQQVPATHGGWEADFRSMCHEAALTRAGAPTHVGNGIDRLDFLWMDWLGGSLGPRPICTRALCEFWRSARPL